MSDSVLNQINTEIDSIRKDPRYLALKNKKRSAQDAERFNVYLRQLKRLEAQKQERLAGNVFNDDNNRNVNEIFVDKKPAFRNQPTKVAHRNQTEGHVSKNWTRNAIALMDAHPKLNEAKEEKVKEPKEPTEVYSLPVVGHKEVDGGHLFVHRLLRRKKRTPTGMVRFNEQAQTKIAKEGRGNIPSVLPREHVEIVEQEFRSTTRKTAPPSVKKSTRYSSDEDSCDDVDANEFNQYLEGAEKGLKKLVIIDDVDEDL